MGEMREKRKNKMNRDKMLKLRAKELRQIHKNISHLESNELYKLENELDKDYFPAE